MTRSELRIATMAEMDGWTIKWINRLLLLTKTEDGVDYLVQVLFKNGRWDYALTFNRRGGYWAQQPFGYYTGVESETQIVRRRADLFAHLASPRA